jgi:hypothetical protein
MALPFDYQNQLVFVPHRGDSMQMRSLMPVVGALTLAAALCGCSSTPDAVLKAQTAARSDYDQTVANYENCIAARPSNPRACERLRQNIEAYE